MDVPQEIAVTKISDRQATIVWKSDKAVQGVVHYRKTASQNEPIIAKEAIAKSYQHRVQLTNLQPGTRYSYWLGDPEFRYQFQTQPKSTDPFSFLLVAQLDEPSVEKLYLRELPDFIFDVTPSTPDSFQLYPLIRPYVPVYKAFMSGSTDTHNSFEKAQAITDGVELLQWGGLQLVIQKSQKSIDTQHFTTTAAIRGLLINSVQNDNDLDANLIEQSQLAFDIQKHNGSHPDKSIAFVLMSSNSNWHRKLNDVGFLGFNMSGIPDKGIRFRFDINTQSVTATNLLNKESYSLQKPPLEEKLTCDDCRRLADKGAYTTAIDAYQAFIRNNKDHFQVDDAYFEIARLYDEKLFDLPEAVTWYSALETLYPTSVLTPLAAQRNEYLKQHSDYNFKPIAQFEKAKKTEYNQKKNNPEELREVLLRVEEIVTQYPTATVAPQILHWLGMQYRTIDIKKALSSFTRLSKNYPQARESREALLNGGDTYYSAGQYSNAKQIYLQAIAADPELEEIATTQISRCDRNILRHRLALGSAVLLILPAAVIVLLRRSNLELSSFLQALPPLCILMAINLLCAWFFHEQFLSTKEMISLSVLLSLSAVWAGTISSIYTTKDCSHARHSLVSTVTSCFIGSIIFLSGVYLSVFTINKHYLIIFKL